MNLKALPKFHTGRRLDLLWVVPLATVKACYGVTDWSMSQAIYPSLGTTMMGDTGGQC